MAQCQYRHRFGKLNDLVKTVLIEPQWKLRQEFIDLLDQPIPGIQFTTAGGAFDALSARAARRNLAYRLHWALLRLLPINLLRAYSRELSARPRDVDLIYALHHPVFKNTPWILDMTLEQPHLLIGGEAMFKTWGWAIKRSLTAAACRRIIFELEAGKAAFLQLTGWHELEPKLLTLRRGVPAKRFTKVYGSSAQKGVTLLFVNSGNINAEDHFYTHGGLVALEAFLRLRQRYEDLRLVIRSNVPESVRRRVSAEPGITLLTDVIPWPELEHEFMAADIFLYPTHVTPSRAFLDAMSYELPIITTDVWGNDEFVNDGQNGLVVHHPLEASYTDGFIVHFDSHAYKSAIRSVDDGLLDNVVAKLSLLIDNPALRRRMGKVGRSEVEEGRFTMDRYHRELQRMLEEALNPDPSALQL